MIDYPGGFAIECCGERLIATPERALLWPARKLVLLADWHLGKAEVFGARGLAIPGGSDADDLERLSRLVRATGATGVIVLGDLMHAPPSEHALWPDELSRWLRAHEAITMTVVAGNHDRIEQNALPAALAEQLCWHDSALSVGPFVFDHHPGPREGGYALAGHLHPVFRLHGGRDRMRAPVFWFRRDHAVFPAFGSFTGGMNVTPEAGERMLMVGPDSVIEVSR